MEKTKCNRCGRILRMEKTIVCEDFIHIKKEWGYFSKKDGITYEFIICEQCAEAMLGEFVIPVMEYVTTELI
ncbi:MAG: hypothetical protein PUC12_08965 [Clostridiales bacterium]|nr:hypothetical protein [Clostridiales bacterium]